MSTLQKITDAQMDEKGVCASPDVLKGSPAANKAVFDRMVRQLVAPAYNAAVDAIETINMTETGIEAVEALRVVAENGRVTAEQGRSGAEVKRVEAESARVAAEEQRVAAEVSRENLESGYVAKAAASAQSAASSAAEAAQIVGGDYATKVGGAVSGNLAGLSENGNLVDSGKKPQDFANAGHKHSFSDVTGELPAHTAHHAIGGSDPLTPAQIGAAEEQILYCTVPVSWTAIAGGFFTQTVSVSGILATDEGVHVDIYPGSDNAANKLYAENWGKVQSMETVNGAIKFVCTAAPTVAFPLKLEVVR